MKQRHSPEAAPPRNPPPFSEPPPPPPPPHVATMLALGAVGWHVTEIRPHIGGGDAPVLWRVTIERYDENVSITASQAADPDAALDELAVYAAADRAAPR